MRRRGFGRVNDKSRGYAIVGRARFCHEGFMRFFRKLGLSLTLTVSVCAQAGAPAPKAVEAATAAAEAGIIVMDTVAGAGAVAQPGSRVTVKYTGWLYEASAPDWKGRQFDASGNHGGDGTFSFALGQHQVISGWDLGVAGMQAGGKRTLIIPSTAGYGARGAGNVIPPNAALVFDIELVAIAN
jgi:FKBP-type peptidyl-prolyl cis-trans isomerase FkpA